MGNTINVALFATTDADWRPANDLYFATARKLLQPFGMNIDAPSTPIVRTIPWTGLVLLPPGDPAAVRYQCHQSLPVGKGIPVVYCKLTTASASEPPYGLTIKTREGLNTNGVPWLPFVLINTTEISGSGETLIHELIHAAYEPAGRIHDTDPKSVFYKYGQGEKVRVLPSEHAQALSRTYFSL